MVHQLDMLFWASGSYGCYPICQKRPRTWNATGILQQMPEVCIQCSNKHQSVTVQELESVHNLCSGALAIVLEGQQVFVQQMDPGRLQLTLQLVRKRTLRIATATAMQFIPGKDCCQVLLHHGCERL